jgi:hypothetical protein
LTGSGSASEINRIPDPTSGYKIPLTLTQEIVKNVAVLSTVPVVMARNSEDFFMVC